MKRVPPFLFNLGAALAGGFGIGAGLAGALEGSTDLLVAALLSAVVCALLQAIAFQRVAADRLDALLAGLRALTARSNGGRL